MNKIYYTKGYKYRVAQKFEVELVGCPDIPDSGRTGRIITPFISIEKREGKVLLTLGKYYSWDGATWAIDSDNFRRGSAVHDALLQMIGIGLLPADPWKLWTDQFLIKLCKEDGMWWPRRKWVYQAVRRLGDPQGSNPRKLYLAP